MLEPHEVIVARSQGWLLADVFDLDTRKLKPQILPISFAPPLARADLAAALVIGKARNNDALALKAVRCVMQGHKQ